MNVLLTDFQPVRVVRHLHRAELGSFVKSDQESRFNFVKENCTQLSCNTKQTTPPPIPKEKTIWQFRCPILCKRHFNRNEFHTFRTYCTLFLNNILQKYRVCLSFLKIYCRQPKQENINVMANNRNNLFNHPHFIACIMSNLMQFCLPQESLIYSSGYVHPIPFSRKAKQSGHKSLRETYKCQTPWCTAYCGSSLSDVSSRQ